MILALFAIGALTLGGCERVSEEVFGARVRAYILEHPEVIEEAALRLEEKKANADRRAAAAAIGPRRASIERDRRDYVANPNGKITVTEFFDYRCGYCKQAAPEVIRLIAENPDVRFVFKELPIFGGISDEAAAITLAAHKQGRYMSLYQAFFTPNNLTPEAMEMAILQSGLNPASLKAASKDSAITQHLADNQRLAKELRIDGTPTFIVGDALIAGADMEALKAEIAKLRKS